MVRFCTDRTCGAVRRNDRCIMQCMLPRGRGGAGLPPRRLPEAPDGNPVGAVRGPLLPRCYPTVPHGPTALLPGVHTES